MRFQPIESRHLFHERVSRYFFSIFFYFVMRPLTVTLKIAWRYLQDHPLCRESVFPSSHDR
jgi:hypothetical protein